MKLHLIFVFKEKPSKKKKTITIVDKAEDGSDISVKAEKKKVHEICTDLESVGNSSQCGSDCRFGRMHSWYVQLISLYNI